MWRLLKGGASRRTRVVSAFLDLHSALMLGADRLRHLAATGWGTRPLGTESGLRNAAPTAALAKSHPRVVLNPRFAFLRFIS